MSERMTEERLAEIRRWCEERIWHAPPPEAARYVTGRTILDEKLAGVAPGLLAEIDALRAELAEARLAAAVADGTATPEMLRDAGLLEWTPYQDGDGYSLCIEGVCRAYCRRDRWGIAIGNGVHGQERGMIANLRAADAAVRKLLAEGEAAG